MNNFNDIGVIIDKCNTLFDKISNEKILQTELSDFKKLYNDLRKSRSAYIDALAYLLIKLLKLINNVEVFPIIRKIVGDNNFVNYTILDSILEGYNGKISK